MTPAQQRIQALVVSIIRYLAAHRDEANGVDRVLDTLTGLNLPHTLPDAITPQRSRHHTTLQRALASLTAPPLRGIADRLHAAVDDLVWREDNGLYYPPGADLGDGYRRCNAHALLIGPEACGYPHPDFSLCVFMLGSRTLYRDHNHPEPELYLTLSERSGWRFDTPHWQDYPAGSLIWNPANAPHATRVYDQPFLSIVAWLEHIDAPCKVIPRDDWAEIERALNQL